MSSITSFPYISLERYGAIPCALQVPRSIAVWAKKAKPLNGSIARYLLCSIVPKSGVKLAHTVGELIKVLVAIISENGETLSLQLEKGGHSVGFRRYAYRPG